MRINYNISAMVANGVLQNNDKALSNSIERLSSGLKINHAKDNASGIAMAKRMNAQIRSLETANQNSNDGVSVIEIAEGALTEVEDMIQRMNELAVKACNGTMTDDDRLVIDEEIKQLKKEIERVANTTMYNGSVLLNGNYDVKGYTDLESVKVTTYSNEVRSGDYSIKIAAKVEDGKILNEEPNYVKVEFGSGFPENPTFEVKGDSIIVSGEKGFSMEFRLKETVGTPGIHAMPEELDPEDPSIVITPAVEEVEPEMQEVNVDITGLGAMNVQIGTSEGQELGVRISTISLRTLGIEDLDVTTAENAMEFLDQMTDTLSYINRARSSLGAYQNRLEHTISTLDISEENMTGAYSRIMDADMAEEMTEYSKNQVLVQASTSMVAQANERPSSVLQLLQ
ncbi:MAG: flagellin FliC3 [Lachnospiraceae bacterium]|nr:flagellin FliC3 [Lachnospiraceae bacterium]